MRLKDIAFYSYSLPLVHPLNMKGYLQYERKGLIIELTDENNNKGYGDAAPFRGLHQESIEDIIRESAEVSAQLYKLNMESVTDRMEQIVSPSLQFALEWALLDLMARSRNMLPACFLNKEYQTNVSVHALLTGDSKEIINSARCLKDKYPPTVKIKVAARPVEEDILVVQKVNEIFAGQVKIRLDANRGWSLEQAVHFAKGVMDSNIEYIEEPLSDPYEQHTFYEHCGIRYALDESLSDCSIEEIKSMNGIAAFVIKPSVLGSLKLIESWIEFAQILNTNIVFSSAFESGIGLRSIAQIAAAFSKDTTHGLDTYRWLKQDAINPAFTINNFDINLEKESGPLNLNKKVLKPLMV